MMRAESDDGFADIAETRLISRLGGRGIERSVDRLPFS